MPSGAKKRKAAKKKLQKAHNNGSHPQGSDHRKSHDDRESDGGEVEREGSEEVGGNNHEHDTEKTSSREANLAENVKEVRPGEKFDDGSVEADGTSLEARNGEASDEHKSSSSSSSEDDDVEVEKDKPVVAEIGDETVKPADYVLEVASNENPVTSEVIDSLIEDSIPVEESVKEVVSSSQESNLVTDSVPIESSTVSDVGETELNQSMNEVSSLSVDQHNVSPVVTDLVQEKVETKVIPVVDNGSGNSSISADTTTRDIEGLLPQASGATTVDKSGGNDHVIESEKVKYSEEQPLISSTPLPVRQTSWMNCCGLFEVFSGGSGR